MYSKTIQKLIDLFSKFPTVGPRTASRFVFYLLKKPKDEIEKLTSAIKELKNNVKICSSCFSYFEGEKNFCEICSNPVRDKSLLCIVASDIDLKAIENTKKYQGFYFVLGGVVSKIKQKEVNELRITELENLIKNRPEIKEIILAFNANGEGETTRLYVERILKPFGKKITRLGRGLPTGGELEYADEETLSFALESRK